MGAGEGIHVLCLVRRFGVENRVMSHDAYNLPLNVQFPPKLPLSSGLLDHKTNTPTIHNVVNPVYWIIVTSSIHSFNQHVSYLYMVLCSEYNYYESTWPFWSHTPEVRSSAWKNC